MGYSLQLNEAMVLMLFVIVTFCDFKNWGLHSYLAELPLKTQDYCLNLLPKNSSYIDIHQALICSHSLMESEHYSMMIHLGLIHLFVVSGFHLNLIIKALKTVFYTESLLNKVFRNSLLFIYIFLCGLKAPILRSYLQWLLPISPSHKSKKVFYIGFILLFLEPKLWCSLSLQLSWISSLIIGFPFLSTTQKILLLYIFVFLFLSPLPVAHPISLICNLLFSPIIGYVFLPLSFLNTLFPFLTAPTDYMWSLFEHLLQNLASEIPLIFGQLKLSITFKWQILIILNLIFIYLETCLKRRQFCKNS